MMLLDAPLLVLAAFALDMLLGDPHRFPHPVRLIGAALDRLEPLGQALPRRFRRAYGLAVAVGLSLSAYAAVALLTRIPGLGWLVALYLSYAGLALGQLMREARAVARLIDSGHLGAARQALAVLVSRDTSALDEAGLRRTLAETLSENFCDGFVAPMFYLSLGGPALLWAYKVVSTMDSMWGYKTERFLELGWAGARGDDALAYVPARLSAALMLSAGYIMGLPARGALDRIRQDARKMSSPNAGWPMAAAAWLCKASMGGPTVYFGQLVHKPIMGVPTANWCSATVRTLSRLVLYSGLLMVLLSAFLVLGSAPFFS